MFRNRLFYALVGLALATMLLITVREANAITAIVKADRSYDQAEQVRLERSFANTQVDRSYDPIETQRLDPRLADHSYDQVEALRSQRVYSSITADRSYDAIESLRVARR